MRDITRDDIRRLLKNFGILADEAISAHLERVPEGTPLHLRVTLEDLTDYPAGAPAEKLHYEVEGQIRH